MKRAITLAILSFAATAIAVQRRASPTETPRNTPRATVTFNKDVAPILYGNCTTCHHVGGAGPFPLIGYEDAKSHARQIAAVTSRRFMPPWPPDREVRFKDERGLSDGQIATLKQWAESGAPEGPPGKAPAPPEYPDGWQLGRPDIVVQAAAGYVLPADGKDVYHNFVFRIPIRTRKYVRAVDIRPGNAKVVHHCNVVIDRNEESRRRDGQNGVPGFDGMDVEMASDVFEPDSHFIYWKPGSPPYFEPAEMTWELDPGTDLVLNVHMRPSGKPEAIQPEIALYFSDKAPSVKPMLMQLDRDDGLDVPAGAKDFQLTDDFTLPLAVEVLAIYPHAHYLGHDLHAYATLPGGARRELIRIRNWDPAWQAVFRYREPVRLPAGTVISMRYVYDNSVENPRNPNSPTKRVRAGNQSTDEMAHLWLQVIPETLDGSDGRPVLLEALMRHKLDRFPSDYAANYNVATLLMSRGKSREATGFFQRAVDTRENSAVALNGLGAALLSEGAVDKAANFFRKAITADPDSADAHFDLATALAMLRDFAGSAKEFQWVIEHRPKDADAEAKLGTVLAELKDYDGAEAHFRRALSIDPENALATQSLKLLQQARSR